MAHHQAGQLPQAEALYREILELSPGHPDALRLLGLIAVQAGQYAVAVPLFAKAIGARPAFAEAYADCGRALHYLQQYRAAVESYDHAIRLNPTLAEAYSDRAVALFGLGQDQADLESCDQAIRLKPDLAAAYGNRGAALLRLQQYQAALESCDQAIRLDPGLVEAHSNRAASLLQLQRHQAALQSSDQAIALRADYAEAHNNRGGALQALGQYQAALESFDRAIQLAPDGAQGYSNRGYALMELRQYQAALESFDRALVLRPGYEYLRGTQLLLEQTLGAWEGIEDQHQQLAAQIDRNERVANPFVVLTMSGSPALQRKAAETYVRDKYTQTPNLAATPHRPEHARIRIGYFSADFSEHPVSYLMTELWESHDRSRFELFGFSFGPEKKDRMQEKVSTTMDRFLDVRSLADRDVAQRSRELEVDIAVDLMGFTKDARMGIFAERAAPIQVSYLGYPGTTGAGFMDYLIADSTLIPESSQAHYSEKIVYLPGSFQPNGLRQPISDKPCSRREQGLPESGFVYCCFNNSYKLLPRTFEIWMRILARVQGSVLWLLGEDASLCANLRTEAERRGISSARLVFSRRVPLDEHIARQRLADLFLDTYPFNAGATASPALRAGLPILTYLGETLAGRMGASLLRAIDLPELVATTEAEYEAVAVELALDSERLNRIKERLRQNILTAPLFNIQSFTSHIEDGYSMMYQRHQAGLPPEHLHVL